MQNDREENIEIILIDKNSKRKKVEISMKTVAEERLSGKYFIDPVSDEIIDYEKVKEKYDDNKDYVFNKEISFVFVNENIKDKNYYFSGRAEEVRDEFLDELPVSAKTVELIKMLGVVSDNYHLNHLKAGNKQQEETIHKVLKETNQKYDYSLACDILKEQNLFEINGFKYGHYWFYEPLPTKIVDLFEKLKEFSKNPNLEERTELCHKEVKNVLDLGLIKNSNTLKAEIEEKEELSMVQKESNARKIKP